VYWFLNFKVFYVNPYFVLNRFKDSAVDTDKTKLHFQRLDLNDSSTMDAFLTLLDKKHAGGFDVLVQNAAIAFGQGATESFDVQAKVRARKAIYCKSLVDMFLNSF
jgi:NADP-dependent 3-hydroxy acid dehydrogenase YdfG